MWKGRSGNSGTVFMFSGGICKGPMGCELSCDILSINWLTAGMHASMFAESAKKARPWLTILGPSKIKSAVNKAVMEMGYAALHNLEAKRSHSWFSLSKRCMPVN